MNLSRCNLLIISVFLFVSITFLSGCKKDGDEEAPLIELTSPTENQEYDVYDEIPVIGSVYDNNHLAYVRIQVIDENMTPVLPAMNFYPEGNSFTINHAYSIDDVLMDSGIYYLQIQASDGVQATNKFVKIKINAAPKVLKYVIAVTKSGSYLNVVKIDSAFNPTTLFSVYSDYLGSGVCNDYGQFYLGGSYTGDINVYEMEHWTKIWDVPVTEDPPFAWFTGMKLSGEYLWVGYQTGKYEKYNHYGQLLMSINTVTTWAPAQFCLIGDKLITEERSTTNAYKELAVRYEYSGAVAGDYFTGDNSVGMLAADASNVVRVINDASQQAYLRLFNMNLVLENDPGQQMGIGKAYGMVPHGTGMAIAHDEGVYLYDPETAVLYLNISAPKTKAVCCDETLQMIIVGQDNYVKYYQDLSPFAHLLHTVTLSDSVVAVHAVYNKD